MLVRVSDRGLRKHCEYRMRTQEQSKKYMGNKETFDIGEQGNMAYQQQYHPPPFYRQSPYHLQSHPTVMRYPYPHPYMN